MELSRFVAPAPRYFLIKTYTSDVASKKDTGIAVLTFLTSIGIRDKLIEVLKNFDVIAKCTYLEIERLKLKFEPLVEIKDIYQTDSSLEH